MSRFQVTEFTHDDRRLYVDTVLNFWRRGAFYSWGGATPGQVDCSGLSMEGLKTVGLYQRGIDRTAQGIFADMVTLDRAIERTGLLPGCLIFNARRDDAGTIYHVETYIGRGRTVGASGGGSKTRTIADAIRDNAFVKIRPIRETEFMFFADPFGGAGYTGA